MAFASAASVTKNPSDQTVRSMLHGSEESCQHEATMFDNSVAILPEWTKLRKSLAVIISDMRFDIFLAVTIVSNLVLVIVETDSTVDDGRSESWMAYANAFILFLYSIELLARVFVLRWGFFNNLSNLLDLAIICTDILFEIMGWFLGDSMPSLAFLRIFRLLRLGRGIKLLKVFPELQLLLTGFVGAIKAIIGGALLIAITITLWSVLAVQIIHPLNKDIAAEGYYTDKGCARCPKAFESVWQSNLTFLQQILAGDSWGEVSMPIIEAHPWTALFFTAVLISVNIAILNLILAVIVDKAQEARQEDMHRQVLVKRKAFNGASRKLLKICEAMDADGNGVLSYDEIVAGWECNDEFADMLKLMDIHKEDLRVVFHILDVDKSGDVDYTEFITELYKMKSHNTHTLLIFIKFYVTEIRQKVAEQLQVLKLEFNKLRASGHSLDHDYGRSQELLWQTFNHIEMRSTPLREVAPPTRGFDAAVKANLQHLCQANAELLCMMEDMNRKTSDGNVERLCRYSEELLGMMRSLIEKSGDHATPDSLSLLQTPSYDHRSVMTSTDSSDTAMSTTKLDLPTVFDITHNSSTKVGEMAETSADMCPPLIHPETPEKLGSTPKDSSPPLPGVPESSVIPYRLVQSPSLT